MVRVCVCAPRARVCGRLAAGGVARRSAERLLASGAYGRAADAACVCREIFCDNVEDIRMSPGPLWLVFSACNAAPARNRARCLKPRPRACCAPRGAGNHPLRSHVLRAHAVPTCRRVVIVRKCLIPCDGAVGWRLADACVYAAVWMCRQGQPPDAHRCGQLLPTPHSCVVDGSGRRLVASDRAQALQGLNPPRVATRAAEQDGVWDGSLWARCATIRLRKGEARGLLTRALPVG